MLLGTIIQILSNHLNESYHWSIGYIATGPEVEGFDEDGLSCYSVQFPYSNEEERIANQVMVREYQTTTLIDPLRKFKISHMGIPLYRTTNL